MYLAFSASFFSCTKPSSYYRTRKTILTSHNLFSVHLSSSRWRDWLELKRNGHGLLIAPVTADGDKPELNWKQAQYNKENPHHRHCTGCDSIY